jgi:hypothetical protein
MSNDEEPLGRRVWVTPPYEHSWPAELLAEGKCNEESMVEEGTNKYYVLQPVAEMRIIILCIIFFALYMYVNIDIEYMHLYFVYIYISHFPFLFPSINIKSINDAQPYNLILSCIISDVHCD